MQRTLHRRAGRALMITLVVTLAVAACQTTPPSSGPAGEAFYQPPSVLPPGVPGDVIWYRPTTVSGQSNVNAWTVLYRSTSATGQEIPVTGTVIVPKSAYAGDRPLITMAPATQGMGDSCAPSKNMAAGSYIGAPDVNAALNKGYAVAMTDYQGLGTPGEHTYIVGPAMGHAVLDMAKAAYRVPGSGLMPTAPVGIWGYSEGGAAAGWAAELAPTYASDLHVSGVAAGGVPADLPAVAASLDGGTGFGFLMSAAVGFDAAYPELNVVSYLNATGRTALADVETQCAAGLFLLYNGKHLSDYLSGPNPLANPTWQARLEASRLGKVRPAVPAFLYHGKTDQIIPYAVGTGLRDRYCALGATVKWKDYPSEHIFTQGDADADVIAWFNDRFSGAPAPSTCS